MQESIKSLGLKLLMPVSPAVPKAFFWGRMGTFINQELPWLQTDSPLGIVLVQGLFPRHPSQLYEGVMEGVFLFSILWLYRKKASSYGVLTSIFLIGYGIIRYFIEFLENQMLSLDITSAGQLQWDRSFAFFKYALVADSFFYVLKNPKLKRKP